MRGGRPCWALQFAAGITRIFFAIPSPTKALPSARSPRSMSSHPELMITRSISLVGKYKPAGHSCWDSKHESWASFLMQIMKCLFITTQCQQICRCITSKTKLSIAAQMPAICHV